jgi:hypothetical protein
MNLLTVPKSDSGILGNEISSTVNKNFISFAPLILYLGKISTM